MIIERKLSIGRQGEEQKGYQQTDHLTPEERISLLEELRYDLGEIAGYDYSQRFKRVISVLKRK